MSLKLILTGATGTAGAEALRQALSSPSISQITVLTRRPTLPAHIVPDPSSHSKLRIIQHTNYSSYPQTLLDELKGYNACVWDLGTASAGYKEEAYDEITRIWAVEAAKAFAELGGRSEKEKFVFCYLSGQGADQREGKAYAMFGRVKGRAEAELAALQSTLPTLAVYSFRPAAIIPIHPTPDAATLQRVGNVIGPWLGKVKKNLVIYTDVLARGMLNAAARGASGRIEGWEGKGGVGNEGVFENVEIKKLAGEGKGE
ncbi:MAG: hypothetical protein MMC33_000255 [Icmadophila ericetorum]|nr:hypothetical protein [Icmadophila ericetorum]